MPDRRLCFLPIFLSLQLRGCLVQKGSWAQSPPLTFSAPQAKSVVVGDESASFREGSGQAAGSQAAARGGRAGSEQTVGAGKLCTEASLPAAPQEVSICEP